MSRNFNSSRISSEIIGGIFCEFGGTVKPLVVQLIQDTSIWMGGGGIVIEGLVRLSVLREEMTHLTWFESNHLLFTSRFCIW